MKRVLFAIGFIFVVVAMWLVSTGLEPKPVRKINPTEFERLDQVGVVTYRRLWGELHQTSVIILGSDETVDGYKDIWSGFLKAARNEGFKADIFIQDTQVNQPQLKIPVQKLDLNLQAEAAAHRAAGLIQQGLKVVIHGFSRTTTHGVENNFKAQLEAQLGYPVTTISMAPFILKRGS